MIKQFLEFIDKPLFISIFAGIASDPDPSKLWKNLYKNIFFRFLIVFIVLYQNSKNVRKAIIGTASTMTFFFVISDKKEREEILSNNFRKKDLLTFIYFCIFLYTANKINLIK